MVALVAYQRQLHYEAAHNPSNCIFWGQAAYEAFRRLLHHALQQLLSGCNVTLENVDGLLIDVGYC